MSLIVCQECGATFDGDRAAAKQAHWEPFSTATQQSLSLGPMVCADCVRRILDSALDAMRAWAARP